MFLRPAVIGAVIALLGTEVWARPTPQGSSSSDCDTTCLSIANVASQCQGKSSLTEQAQCYCGSSGFLSAAQACYNCGGGTYFSGSNLDLLQQAISACGQLNGGATGAASSAAITSAATAASSASSAAVSSSAVSGASRASGSAVAVTEAATQPINVTAWAPEGFTPTLTYGIAATGGVNTTIGAALAVTTTDSIGPFTATVTVDFVLGPTELVQIQQVNGLTDVTDCVIEEGGSLRNGTVAECEEIYYSGSAAFSTSTYNLTGATTVWTAYPTSTLSLASATADASASSSAPAAGPSSSGGSSSNTLVPEINSSATPIIASPSAAASSAV